MSSHFISNNSDNSDVSDGSIPILGSTIGAKNFTPNMTLKSNGSNQIITSLLDITDINNLTSSLVTISDDIITNTTDIATNTTEIATFDTAINDNTNNIATNTTDIATNTADITTNTNLLGDKVNKSGDTMTGDLITTNIRTTEFNVHLGLDAGVTQSGKGVAIGSEAGNVQGNCCVAIGCRSGRDNQGNESIAIGLDAGENILGSSCVAIGAGAGKSNSTDYSLYIGHLAGINANNFDKTVVLSGSSTGINPNADNQLLIKSGTSLLTHDATGLTTNIDIDSVSTTTGSITTVGGVGIGKNLNVGGIITSSNIRTAGTEVHLGLNAGLINQGLKNVAIGELSGNLNQGDTSVAIGADSGRDNQAIQCVAVGYESGEVKQGLQATALGSNSGATDQGAGSVCLGSQAGKTSCGVNAICIGNQSGKINTTDNSMYIGTYAGLDSGSYADCIVLNATGIPNNPTEANQLIIKSGTTELKHDTTGLTTNIDIESTSTTTGSITTVGGVGIGKNLNVGGIINSSNITALETKTAPLSIVSTYNYEIEDNLILNCTNGGVGQAGRRLKLYPTLMYDSTFKGGLTLLKADDEELKIMTFDSGGADWGNAIEFYNDNVSVMDITNGDVNILNNLDVSGTITSNNITALETKTSQITKNGTQTDFNGPISSNQEVRIDSNSTLEPLFIAVKNDAISSGEGLGGLKILQQTTGIGNIGSVRWIASENFVGNVGGNNFVVRTKQNGATNSTTRLEIKSDNTTELNGSIVIVNGSILLNNQIIETPQTRGDFDAGLSSTLYEDIYVILKWNSANKQPVFEIKTGFTGYWDVTFEVVKSNNSIYSNDDVNTLVTDEYYFTGLTTVNTAYNAINYSTKFVCTLQKENTIPYVPCYYMTITTGSIAGPAFYKIDIIKPSGLLNISNPRTSTEYGVSSPKISNQQRIDDLENRLNELVN